MATSLADVRRARVTIDLNGDLVELRPTPDAILALSAKYDGFGPLLAALQRYNMQAFIDVVVTGAGAEGRDAKALRDRTVLEGMPSLMGPVSEFVTILANGGRPIKEEASEVTENPQT
jgi:hypothetical protein